LPPLRAWPVSFVAKGNVHDYRLGYARDLYVLFLRTLSAAVLVAAGGDYHLYHAAVAMSNRPYAPRERLLFGKMFHRNVPAADHVSLFRLFTDHDRADVREVANIEMGGDEYIRATVVYYIKVKR
jgi:hypothetical protein